MAGNFPAMRGPGLLTALLLLLFRGAESSSSSALLPRRSHPGPGTLGLRGGGGAHGHADGSDGDGDGNGDDDDERYSRQVYTLGARAHGLVRSCTVVLDGPPSSGLLYECGKNLALSGVGSVVLLVGTDREDGTDAAYHHAALDDLGRAYGRAARAETGMDPSPGGGGAGNWVELAELAAEEVRRLNPAVRVSTMAREEFLRLCGGGGSGRDGGALGTNPVFLAVDRPQSTQLVLNGACRRGGVPFVSVETAGVHARGFCDFGPAFTVVDEDGETPRETLLGGAEPEPDQDGSGTEGCLTLTCLEDERHEVSRGDLIEFQLRGDVSGLGGEGSDGEGWGGGNALGRCEVMKVHGPTRLAVRQAGGSPTAASLSLRDLAVRIGADGLSFSRVKVPREVPFLSLGEALEGQDDPSKEVFAAADLEKSFDSTRRSAVMASFAALDRFAGEKGRLPSASSEEDMVSFRALAEKAASSPDAVKDAAWSSIVGEFGRCAKAKLAPVQALCGAFGAQEVLKAASGLYNPIRQFLLYDCDELLQTVAKGTGEEADEEGCYGAAGQSYILGKPFTKRLASQRLFVVGSGAIGCEILKNLSAMGAGARKSKGGKIILTDMDTIEKSNLSRQLLFRDMDVGKFKSEAAQEAVLRFNPDLAIEACTSKVGDDVEGGVFDDGFWSDGIDTILNALDNVEARLYMDSQCVANRKGLIDAGTLGAKGNVQVVVPGQSESYGSSADPPEPAIPVCTLKNFPYEISHTIQWGRDMFGGLYNRRPSQVNDSADAIVSSSAEDFAMDLIDNLGDDAAIAAAMEMRDDFVPFSSTESIVEDVKKASTMWAIQLMKKLFTEAIHELLRKHPIDSVDEEGDPFWSGTRRAPKPLVFDESRDDEAQRVINEHMTNFVRAAARLRSEVYLPADLQVNAEGLVSADDVIRALRSSSVEGSNVAEMAEDDADVPKQVAALLAGAKSASAKMRPLNLLEFEKDDDANGHVAFVTAASNLRALCYGIKPVDAMETRRVAGRIVPAMITTTAFVSALSCIELLKLQQRVPLALHRNAFVNLALPFFAFTCPMPAEELPGPRGQTYTLWDRITVTEGERAGALGGMRLGRFLGEVRKKAAAADPGLEAPEVATVSYGPYLLYANFLHDGDEDILQRSMMDLVKEAVVSGDDIDDDLDFGFSSDDDDEGEEKGETELTSEQREVLVQLGRRRFFDFSVIVEDPETGDEAELPPVRMRRCMDVTCTDADAEGGNGARGRNAS